MIAGSTPMKRLALAAALLASCLAVATAPLFAGAATRPAPAPQMLAGVNGSSIVYVLSTSVHFDGTNPAMCHYQACYDLRRTNDNGSHFTTLKLPPIAYVHGALTGDLERLVFANSNDGYAILGTSTPSVLYVTMDGARSWHQEAIAPGFSIFDCTATRNKLYAVIARCPKDMDCTDFRIARSSLAAVRWSTTPLPTSPPGTGVGMGAFGSNVWLSRQSMATALLLISHNGGRSFTRWSVPVLGSVVACSMTAMSATALWAQCPTGMAVSFFYSGDGGTRWNRIPVSQFMGTGGGAFDPVSSAVAYLDYGLSDTSSSDNLFRVTNDGRTMTAVGKLACDIANGLVFTNVTHGLAACDRSNTGATTHLLGTSDGGATWTKVGLN